jgi:ABC-type phosphate/phosphonate transport system permease subunit
MALNRIIRHPLSPIARRSAYALLAILIVMTIGTVGVKMLGGFNWVYSFFFMSMVATGQGPPSNNLNSSLAEIFVSIMAFVSVGTLITAIGVIFGPFFGYLFHKGVRFSEKEIEKLEKKEKIQTPEKA